MRSRWKITILFMTMILAVPACTGKADTDAATENVSQKEQETRETETPGKSFEVRETDYDKENPPETTEPQNAEEEPKVSPKNKLTLEKILELSGKEDTGWEDFKDYPSQDIGFGLLILLYEVDKDFSLIIGGGGIEEPPMYIYLAAQGDEENCVDIRTGDVEGYIREHRSAVNYIGIKGHIKEVHEEYVLISSDTDDFPGVFGVSGVRELAEPGELKGGTSVFVLMEEPGEKDDSGIPRCEARQFYALSEERAEADILLTDAPGLVLTDVLSSRYDPFTVRPGNYSWDVEENGEGKGIVACGTDPLTEAGMQQAARLKLPRYNRLDSVGYMFSTGIMPDRLTVRCWSSQDIGNSAAEEESIITYYYMPFILNLEPGKVYGFAAEWKKENMKQRKFSGSASYVVVTEQTKNGG